MFINNYKYEIRINKQCSRQTDNWAMDSQASDRWAPFFKPAIAVHDLLHIRSTNTGNSTCPSAPTSQDVLTIHFLTSRP